MDWGVLGVFGGGWGVLGGVVVEGLMAGFVVAS